jgi:hypothetical protein
MVCNLRKDTSHIHFIFVSFKYLPLLVYSHFIVLYLNLRFKEKFENCKVACESTYGCKSIKQQNMTPRNLLKEAHLLCYCV